MAKVEVESEVTGNVWKVEVSAGAAVSAGQVLIILESMKMEIPVLAPRAGKLTALHVSEEDMISEDQAVAELEVP